jgi:hypothetical protein
LTKSRRLEASDNGESIRQETLSKVQGNMGRRTNIFHEFVLYLKAHKAYWMIPILLVFSLLAVLLILGGTGAAPFIYTLF